MTDLRTFISRWFPVGLWIATIYVGSSRPVLPGPLSSNSFEAQLLRKAVHFIEYAGLATLLYRALGGNLPTPRNPGAYHKRASPGSGNPEPSRGKCLMTAFLLATALGLVDEWHQSFVPNRNASLWDVSIDALGAGLALVAVGTINGVEDPAGQERGGKDRE